MRSALSAFLALALAAAAPAPPADSVQVTIEAGLAGDGALKGTLSAHFRGGCAAALDGLLEGKPAAERDRALSGMLAGGLAGSVKEVGREGPATTVRFALDAPRYAPAVSGGLSIPLPRIEPFDFTRPARLPVPCSILTDVSLRLPAGMAPASLPSAFSTITPDAGRYVLHLDVDVPAKGGDAPRTLTVRRELQLTGRARLAELMEAVRERDAARVTVVPVARRGPGA